MIYRGGVIILSALFFGVIGYPQSQPNNSIAGFVFSPSRQAVDQINVELLDEFGRLLRRTLTDGSGRYGFFRMASGKYQVRVMAMQYGYEEQVQEVEIVNFSRQSTGGSPTFSGSQNVQMNFSLSPRRERDETKKGSRVIFAQEIPEAANKHYKQGISNFDQHRSDEGIKELEEATRIFPAFYYALERLGQEYIKRERFVNAETVGKKAVEVNPKNPQAWYILGYALYGTKKLTEALQSTGKSIEIDPASVDARFLMGVLYRQNSQYKDAEKQLKKAKELAKIPVADIHWQLALLYNYNLKEYKLAADELELYLKAMPDRKDDEIIKKLIRQMREKAGA